MSEINRVTVYIQGAEYPITTSEEPKYVVELATELNEQLSRVMQSNRRLGLTEALVLLNLNYQDLYRKAKGDTDRIRDQLAEYLEEASRARMEAEDARKEIARLERLLGNKKGSR
ncbi:cell division protein ZapA [Oscillospiraceae bacterium MB08-C2-2]|nr:cell division protein ZapA [Oscillospiraceae bacterium MB08-C2-2]